MKPMPSTSVIPDKNAEKKRVELIDPLRSPPLVPIQADPAPIVDPLPGTKPK